MKTLALVTTLFAALAAGCGDDVARTYPVTDVPGPAGADGIAPNPVVSSVPELPGANCASGGVAVTLADGGTFFICNGSEGKAGADGLVGPAGQDGTNTTTVVQGPQGEKGEPGIDGKDGVDGINGVDGKDGIDGVDGVDGKDGVDGAQGPAGPAGPAGSDGVITVVSDAGSQVSCSGTILSGRRVSYKAQSYSDGLIFATASVEENSNSSSGFELFATNSPNRATAPVSVFANNVDYYIVSADRVTKTLLVSSVSGTTVTPLVVSNISCQ